MRLPRARSSLAPFSVTRFFSGVSQLAGLCLLRLLFGPAGRQAPRKVLLVATPSRPAHRGRLARPGRRRPGFLPHDPYSELTGTEQRFDCGEFLFLDSGCPGTVSVPNTY